MLPVFTSPRGRILDRERLFAEPFESNVRSSSTFEGDVKVGLTENPFCCAGTEKPTTDDVGRELADFPVP